MSNITNLDAGVSFSKLREGNKRFQDGTMNHPNQNPERRESKPYNLDGQLPWAIVIGCADSRVTPEIVFDTGLGELFTVRVAGNVANISSIASIEYAVAHLNVKLIIVLGHESCGAVKAAIDDDDNGYNLNILTSYIKPAVRAIEVATDHVAAVVKENARQTARDLVAKSSIIREATEWEVNGLRIIPAYYHLKSGEVEFLDRAEV